MKKKDKKFYSLNTHKKMQPKEESVETCGDGFVDAYVPQSPTTDSFYNTIINWKRR